MGNFNLSAFLKSKRAELNMTTRELAEKVGVSATTITKWENGDIKNLRKDKIEPLAKALRIHPLKLLGYAKIDDIKDYDETPIKKIPFYSVHNTDFFNENNVLRFICTDVDADFAVGAIHNHEDVVRPHDVLLFSRAFNDLHNKYLLLINDDPTSPPYMDKAVMIHNKLFLYNNAQYSALPDTDKVIGVLVEIRRLV